MDWWNISVFGIIFFIERKFLWAAPLISTVLSVAISGIAMPSFLSNSEARAKFFGISIPMHLAIVVVLTVIAYFVVYILKRKKK